MIRLLVILMLANQLIAGINNQSSDRNRNFQVLRHNVNRVEMCISNYGKFGQDEAGCPNCWWPTGSYNTYMYGSGVWFGTVDSLTGDTLVTVGYGLSGGESEFAPGLSGMSVGNPDAVIYMYPSNWPPPQNAFPMAPQVNISHQDSWCCFNDSNLVYHLPGGRPIGIECYQTVYAWNLPILTDMIFFTHEFNNVSGHTLNDCYMAVCFNIDIGLENNRCAGIVEKCYIINGDTMLVDDIGYQWQEPESPGTPPYPSGVIFMDFLQTPFDLQWGMDKDGDGIPDQYERDSIFYVSNLPQYMWDADNDGVPDWRDPSQWPQLGMTALKRFTPYAYPISDSDCYLTMAGYEFLTGIYEPYDTNPSPPDDYVFVMASGPFSLPPDSSTMLIFAVMLVEWWDVYSSPDSAFVEMDDYAQDYYNMYWYLYTGIEENFELRNSDCQLRITPNPVVRGTDITFSLSTSDYVSLNLYNSVGQHVVKIMEGYRAACVHNIVIDTGMLAQGTYFLCLETSKNREYHTIVVLR